MQISHLDAGASSAKPMTDAPINLLLAALPPNPAQSFMPSLKREVFHPHQVLFDIREQIRRVFFPLNAVLSLLIPFSNGETVETAMVGRDGMIGGLTAFGAKHSTSRAVVQIPG